MHVFQYFEQLSHSVVVWIAFCLRRVIHKHHPLWSHLLGQQCTVPGRSLDKVLEYMSVPTINSVGMELFGRLHSQMRCSRSGCFQYFRHADNYLDVCRYHPGKMNNCGKLSCCRATSFSVPGCKSGWHDSSFFEFVHRPRETSDRKLESKTGLFPSIAQSTSPRPAGSLASKGYEGGVQPLPSIRLPHI
jgi:hypothetical protein